MKNLEVMKQIDNDEKRQHYNRLAALTYYKNQEYSQSYLIVIDSLQKFIE